MMSVLYPCSTLTDVTAQQSGMEAYMYCSLSLISRHCQHLESRADERLLVSLAAYSKKAHHLGEPRRLGTSWDFHWC